MAQTIYNRLQSKKRTYCKGSIRKDEVKKVARDYIRDRVEKGENKKTAERKANKVLHRACGKPAYIGKRRNKRKKN